MTDAHHTRPRRRSSFHRELWLGPALVWLVLLAILSVSAWSAFFPLGPYNPTINLLLAALMLFLLATFLMDLRSASHILRMVAVGGLFWVVFLFALTFTDYLSRRPTIGVAPPVHSSSLTHGTHCREARGRWNSAQPSLRVNVVFSPSVSRI